MPASSAIPLIGIGIAALLAITPLIVKLFSGCGQTCIQATKIANQAATLLQQNMQAYFSSPVRTASMQAAALNNFDTVWAALQQGCSQGSLGPAGVACISERQRGGASKWCCSSSASTKVSTSCQGGPPCCTGCDWFVLYRDPISNDTAVTSDPVTATGTSLLSAVGISPNAMIAGVPVSNLILPAAAAALLLWWNS